MEPVKRKHREMEEQMGEYRLSEDVIGNVERILRRGNRAEVAVERGRIVVIEVRRVKLD